MSRIKDLVAKAKARFAQVRARHESVDHGVRAFQHFSAVDGNARAASVTYFSFLSFFPIIALAFAVLGFVARVYPDAVQQGLAAISDYLPGLVGQGPNKIDVSGIAGAAGAVTIFGLLGLLYSGLGWVDALRQALHRMWGTERPQGNMVKQKLWDILVLIIMGVAVLASVAVSSLATSATTVVLGWVGLDGSIAAKVLVRLLALAVALGVDTLILVIIFNRLSGRQTQWRNLARGAFLGAVLLEVLKLVGTWLIGRTTSNPVYGTFAVVVGLLVWLNFIARALLLSAAWTVTQPTGPFGRGPADDEGAPEGSETIPAAPESDGDVDPDATAPHGGRVPAGATSRGSGNGALRGGDGATVDVRDSARPAPGHLRAAAADGRRTAAQADGAPSPRATMAAGVVTGLALGVVSARLRGRSDGSDGAGGVGG